MMLIKSIRWTVDREAHIARHNLLPDEVEEAIFSDQQGKTFFVSQARRNKEEKVYAYLGRTGGGRYIKFIYIYEGYGVAFPVMALDMSKTERRIYHGK
ncbi:hypothetical protein MFMK1_000649 [Metallumcola ferriviriculae]|uniref:BrnT family toxin n=1 Tax=Metallumcola ferriviriculae TaxID=3039180 RepID=A0AAU0UJ94_9FIRM|nr:hypothetical protein MFMK1_000649 [Desulfitibacteraceae bacterium MK1]